MGSGQVPEMWDLGKYHKCGIWASTRKVDPGKYWKCGIWASTRTVGSRRVPEMWDMGKYQKGRIWASTGKVEIPASTGSGRNPGEMLENPKQAKRSKQTQGKVVGPSMTSRVYQQMTRISQKSNTIMTKEGGMPQYDNRKCHK